MEQCVADNIAVLHGVGYNPVPTLVYDMGDRRTEVNHPASASRRSPTTRSAMS